MRASWNPIPPTDRSSEKWRAWANSHPVSTAMGLVLTEVGEDNATFSLEGATLPNPNGSLHGGVLAAALDQVLAVAVLRTMPAGYLPNTATMSIQYLRPAMTPLRLHSWVTKSGRGLAFSNAAVDDRDGHLCATADGAFAVVDAGFATSRR